MTSVLIKLFKNSRLLLKLYNLYFKLVNSNKFWQEINTRKELDLFDYENLAKPIPYFPIEEIKDANYYGHIHALKEYTGLSEIAWSIEHGLYYSSYIPLASKCKTIRRIITFSEHRANVLNSLKKPVAIIGPYVHYATPLLDESEIAQLKTQLGKTLLFFPLHSTFEDANVYKYEVNNTIGELLKIKQVNHIDTVIVNMYYYDLLHTDIARLYEEAGFKVSCAGHLFDLNFIKRLKTLILISDVTYSNSVGTHVGYCVYLGKPHTIICSDICNTGLLDWDEINNTFIADNEKLKYEIASKYWGFDNIKTKSELLNLLK